MKRNQLCNYGEALENVKDINILECSEQDIFNVMKNALLKAFDRETTFDMRMLEQMELLEDKCDVGVVLEADNLMYPYIKLVIAITDGYYDDVQEKFKMYSKRDAEFDVLLTPFVCELDKHDERVGVYGGSNKDLTTAWRRVLISIFPKWEEKFKEYLERIKKSKIEAAQGDSKSKIDMINRKTKAICDKAEEEYNSELATIGLE